MHLDKNNIREECRGEEPVLGFTPFYEEFRGTHIRMNNLNMGLVPTDVRVLKVIFLMKLR